MSSIVRFSVRRLLIQKQPPLAQVLHIQKVGFKSDGLVPTASDKLFPRNQRYMPPASNSPQLITGLLKDILSFGNTNFRHKYDPNLVQNACEQFLAVGVELSDLKHAFCRKRETGSYSDPHIFAVDLSVLQKLLDVFVDHRVSPKAIIRVVIYYGSDIKSLSPSQLNATLEELVSLDYLDIPMTSILDVCPQLVYFDHEMRVRLEKLRHMFPQKELKHLLRNAPNVVSDAWSTTEDKIMYIYEEMGLDQPHVAYNKALSCSLQHIKDRHEAMVRTGSYKRPKLHKDRLSHLMNAKMAFIMESSDAQFCKRILQISLEDYESFLQLLHRERQEDFEGVHLDDYESDEEESREQEAARASYGQQNSRHLHNKPTKDYQRWIIDM